MSSVLKKADKLNLSLSLSGFANLSVKEAPVCITDHRHGFSAI